MIAGLEPYPVYRDSGVRWLGEVPARWETQRAKVLFRKADRPVRPDDEIVTCFRDGTVTLRRKRRLEGFTEAIQEIGYQGIRRGDLVIHQMDAFAGAVGVSDSDGKGSPVCAVCVPIGDARPGYYKRVVREMALNGWIAALAKGVRERSTEFRFETFARQHLPVPEPAEQDAIVRFLDHSEARIRRLIVAKERLIALLEEEKHAAVLDAVTRGIDPDVPLRESGIEWCEEVPAHWATGRLGHSVASHVTGAWGGEPNGEDDVLCIRVADFDRVRRRVRPGATTMRALPAVERRRRRLQAGDLLIEKSGGGDSQPVGTVVLFDQAVEAVSSNFVARLRTAPGYVPGYLLYLHWALYVRRVNVRSVKQTTGIQNLDLRSYLSEQVPFPPLAEQEAIARRLAAETAEIDRTVESAQSYIRFLREYLERLISDVVTGKLDVREVAERLPEGPDGDGSTDELVEEAVAG